MKKYILMIIILIAVVLAGCAKEKTTVETPINNNTEKREQVTTTVTDGGISVRIISKPQDKEPLTAIIDTDSTVDIMFVATQDGYNSGDFSYNYKLSKDGVTDTSNSLASDVFSPTNNVRFTGLLPTVGEYAFQIMAYNRKSGKISAFGDAFKFKIVAVTSAAISDDVVLNNATLDKKNLFAGDTVKVTYTMSNFSKTERYIKPETVFGGQEKVWELTASDAPQTIQPSATITFTETYKLSESYLAQGSAAVNTHGVTTVVRLDSNEKTNAVSNSIDVVIKEKVNLVPNYIDPDGVLSSKIVTAGQSEIKVGYYFNNLGSQDVYIKDIKPKFYTSDGVDVSEFWTQTGTSKIETVKSGETEIKIERAYTLASNAKGGEIYIDAEVTAAVGGAYGLEVKYNNFRKRGKISVIDSGEATINAWIAVPEGAKNGEVYTGQEITIYGIVNYNGNTPVEGNTITSTLGEYEIVWSEIDGASLSFGDQKRADITLNKQFNWVIRMGNYPIQGNIYIRVNKPPTLRNTNMPIAFTSNVKAIPIKVIQKPTVNMSAGIEEDNYGAKDGIVKAGTVEKVYALAENTNTTQYTGDIKIAIDLALIDGATLAPGEVKEKVVKPGTKAVWSVKLPESNKNGSVLFNVIDSAIDPKTGEKPVYVKDYASVRIGSVMTGTIKLQEVKCDYSAIRPGDSNIPVAFVLENTGSAPIKITDLQGLFTLNGVDVSSKFTLTNKEDFYGTVIEANTGNIEIRARYKMMENRFDGSDILRNVRIGGSASAIDTIVGEVLTDNISTIDGWVYVVDTVPPVLVVEEEITGKVGEAILFDASGSTDNFGIQYYQWDFDINDGISDNTAASRGEKVYHTYTKPGLYTATIVINDGGLDYHHDGSPITIKANGPVTKKIFVTVE